MKKPTQEDWEAQFQRFCPSYSKTQCTWDNVVAAFKKELDSDNLTGDLTWVAEHLAGIAQQFGLPIKCGYDKPMPQFETLNQLEAKAIHNALIESEWDWNKAALALGIGRATLYRKVKQHGITK